MIKVMNVVNDNARFILEKVLPCTDTSKTNYHTDQAAITMDEKDKLIAITVIPKSRRSHLIVDQNGSLKAYLHAPPAEGKANAELIVLLSQALHLKKSDITIIRGSSSRKKVIRCADLTTAQVIDSISRLVIK